MCSSGDHDHHAGDVVQSVPRPVEGEAVDAIGLEPVDEVMITTLVDNSYDALLADAGPVRRARRGRFPSVPAPQFEQGETTPGLVAEHGFAALVTTRRGDRTHTVLFDTGVSPNGLADNLERLDLEAATSKRSCSATDTSTTPAGFPVWRSCAAGRACRSRSTRSCGRRAASCPRVSRSGSCRC